jgi:ascorbate-specific PTS system EIIC-type component UlaA
MTKRQAIKYSLLNSLLILVGAFILYKVWWTNNGARFLGIIGYLFVGFGSILLSVSLTRIFFSTKANFDFTTLSNPKKYQILKDTIGASKVKVINTIYCSLSIIIFGSTAYGLVIFLNNYEKEQLKNFGRLQKVKIYDIHHRAKTRYAFFEFYLDGKKYTNNLSPKNYSVGDSATIIFSTHNTDIVKWADDFEGKRNE